MPLKDQLSNGWSIHANDPEGVSAQFESALSRVATAPELLQVAGLFVHVDGEHLGQWARAIERVDRLLAHPSLDDEPTRSSLLRSRAAMSLCADDPEAADALVGSERVRVLAVAASAAVGQERVDDGARWFAEAVRLACALKPEDAAIRSVAITANNLAAGLEQIADRTEAQTALMLDAAGHARTFWELAGTWLHVERAEHRLAMSHLQAGQSGEALVHAERCLQICLDNDAAAGERFFAHEARAKALSAGAGDGARAARDQAAQALDAMTDAGFKSWCTTELQKLDALLSV